MCLREETFVSNDFFQFCKKDNFFVQVLHSAPSEGQEPCAIAEELANQSKLIF